MAWVGPRKPGWILSGYCGRLKLRRHQAQALQMRANQRGLAMRPIMAGARSLAGWARLRSDVRKSLRNRTKVSAKQYQISR